MTSTPATAAPGADTGSAAVAQPHCANCGTALLGEHCHVCGQPVRGLVRHFSSIVGDFFDSVFELDSRILNTVAPLFFRPGHLSTEYFAGRRVRYVSPVRLFVFLSILTFFVARLSMSFDGDAAAGSDAGVGMHGAFASATTPEEVERIRRQALEELSAARREAASVPGVATALDTAGQRIDRGARARLAQLGAADPGADGAGPAPGRTPAPLPIRFGDGDDWNPVDNPIEVEGLPAFANGWLNRQVARAQRNLQRIGQEPDAYKDALLGAIPTTLFVLLPIFALMLKTAYLFKRRLYMEHLIVALHSHAFICMAILALLLVYALQAWLAPTWPAVGTLLSWVLAAIYVWIPLYLLIAQKRVYGQGWPATLLKYAAIGLVYLVLLSMGLGVATVTSLVRM
ncbi:DUF3667 domain-containing protein [Coralloluteibacterium thermophilus]|uniref:DUF3667 domain-containing protein n=1 Tax=Coralloluteibacterium thermophilum TaxID=2707049 RepID=A0ABV9NGA6_9GAMM